jgi:hypothetical protein
MKSILFHYTYEKSVVLCDERFTEIYRVVFGKFC